MTYNHHVPCKEMMCRFLKKSPNIKTILAGSKPVVLHCRFVALWKHYAGRRLRVRFNVWGHQYGYMEVVTVSKALKKSDVELHSWERGSFHVSAVADSRGSFHKENLILTLTYFSSLIIKKLGSS